MKVSCNQCNKEFDRPEAEVRRHNKSYCSRKCQHLGQYKRTGLNCTQCNKSFEKLTNELSKSGNNFCSRSCAAKYNNQFTPKRQKTKKCKFCDNLIYRNYTYCDSCIEDGRHLRGQKITTDRTIDSMIKRKDANRYSYIRYHARQVMKHEVQTCSVCKYDKHVEVCHIKDISQFPLDAKLAEVNARTNLVLLCPNCHWEFDHDLLKI
jgi:5-methylcytosine-specific restriction endonuclease McrA